MSSIPGGASMFQEEGDQYVVFQLVRDTCPS